MAENQCLDEGVPSSSGVYHEDREECGVLKNTVYEESRKRTTAEVSDAGLIQDLERTHVRDVNNLTSQLRQYQLCDKESKEKAKASALKVWAGLLCFFYCYDLPRLRSRCWRRP